MDYTLEEALPQVYIEQCKSGCVLHWDVKEFEACDIIDENRDYIEGFLDGCYKLLSREYKLPTKVWGHRSGHVSGISEEAAKILLDVIEGLLHSLVEARYNNLLKD